MPVPAPNLYPDFNIIRLSHVCLNVKDLAASKKFYTEFLGLQVTDETDTHVYLCAMEERSHHCVILQKSDRPGTVEVMGFKTIDEDDLDRAEAWFTSKGRSTAWVKRAYQGRTLLTSDNMGIPLEFYPKMDRLAPIHQKYARYRGVMVVTREETFGPVAPLSCFETEAHVVTAANDTEFGLAAYFYSRDHARVWRMSEALDYGMVGVNTGLVSTAEAPFGGVKQSGLGHEGSRHGLDDILEIKYICMGGIDAAKEA